LWSKPNFASAPTTADITIHQNLENQTKTLDRRDLISSWLSGWLIDWVGLFLILVVKGDLLKNE
jgi:hypothetical protein